MHFRTKVNITAVEQSIGLQQGVFTVGSCFADVIGEKLADNKFQALANPFGTTYNPYSIHKLLRYAIQSQEPEADSFLQNADVYLNYNFHSELSALNKSELDTHIQIRIKTSHEFLRDSEWLIITYGTAWVYERNDNNEIVANCHKMPDSHFTKQLLSQKKILESFDELYKELKAFNPKIKIILTVSPVRHMKDTFRLNNVSKSALLLSCFNLTLQYADVNYFPAYEIMMDELRDYRFYKTDMLHPSEEAEEYVWQKFKECYFDKSVNDFIAKWKKIKMAMQHRAFHRSSVSHQQFLQQTLTQLEELANTVDVSKEIAQIKSQII